MKHRLAFAIAASAIAASSPALADIIQVDPSTLQGDNVLFNNGPQTGTTVIGSTQGGTDVAFSGTTFGGGNVLYAAGGQANVSGDFDTTTPQPNDTLQLTSLTFGLNGGGFFDDVELNLFGASDNATADFILTDDAGQVFNFTNIALGNGENRLGFAAVLGQSISSLSFVLTSGTINDVRQVRITPFTGGGNGVPEPAAWAMMLSGFGLAGAALRRPRRAPAKA